MRAYIWHAKAEFIQPPEKYTQPCEIGLNNAEYTTTFLKIFNNFYKHISTFQKISALENIFLFNI
jgi:hypothetical protein